MAFVRSEKYRGALCGKTASRDLRGGCQVTGSPTSIKEYDIRFAGYRLDAPSFLAMLLSGQKLGHPFEDTALLFCSVCLVFVCVWTGK